MLRVDKALLYVRTLRYLRPIQIFGRAWYHFHRPAIHKGPPPAKFHSSGRWEPPPRRHDCLKGPRKFFLLNKEVGLTSWHPDNLPKLWVYHLHYFDACASIGSESQYPWHRHLIRDWIIKNPPVDGIGWESYPLSRRLVNWFKGDIASDFLEKEALHGLAIQARYLSKRCEYYLQGNHLWTNGKALFFAGLYFGGHLQLGESRRWLNKGVNILQKELDEEVRPDGSHYEQSPMYHTLFLEDVLDLLNICQAFRWQPDFMERLRKTAGEMLGYLQGVCHPDGQICLFNDAAFNMSPSPEEIEDYAQRLNVEPIVKADKGMGWHHWKHSGLVKIDRGPWQVFFDTGPIGPDHIPGHAHADNLTVEISHRGRRLVVDTGTGEYGVSPERHRQRSTSAHNTLMVDDTNSSEIWAGFRVARRAYPLGKTKIEDTGIHIVCEAGHDGYKRLPGNIIHRRVITARELDIVIEDKLEGAGEHEVAIQFHFHPGIIAVKGEGCFNLVDEKSREDLCTVSITGVETMRVGASTYHPEFGLSFPNKKITGWVRTRLPAKITTIFAVLS